MAALSYGFALMMMAEGAIAQSIAIAAMPTLSAQYALGKMDDLRASLSNSLRGVILLALPAATGLILLRLPDRFPALSKRRVHRPLHPAGGLGPALVCRRVDLPFDPGGAGEGILCHARYQDPRTGWRDRHGD